MIPNDPPKSYSLWVPKNATVTSDGLSEGRRALRDMHTGLNKDSDAQVSNRALVAAMRKGGSNMQLAYPKIRQPLGSLTDMGIPHDVSNEEELKEIRRWCRLFYATHDLVPLLIDIYSRFPVVGMEFDSKDPLIKKFYEEMFLGDD